jgi:acyl-CoA reductase-like NAD-dependent aldehyde dehydrogenase
MNAAGLEAFGLALARQVVARRDELIDATSADLRFPVRDMQRDVDRVIHALEHLGEAVGWLEGRRPICGPGEEVAILLPFNLGAVAISLAATFAAMGNPVRARFSSKAPTVARVASEIFASVELPSPVVLDDRSGREFLHHALTDPHTPALLAYGGEALGDELLAAAAGTHILFEGPGKDPMIVGPEARPEQVQAILRTSKFSRSGQECISTERVVIPEGMPELVEAIVDMTSDVRASPSWDPDAEVTELANPVVPAIIERQLAEAVERGARVLVGGTVTGNYVEPTVVVDVPVDTSLWQDETFGPVIALRTAPDLDAAAADALSGRYGLHAILTGVGAGDLEERLVGAPYAVPVDGLQYGKIGVASRERQFFADPLDDHRPFGGWGISGWIRERSGRLRQGPRVLAREVTVPEEEDGQA